MKNKMNAISNPRGAPIFDAKKCSGCEACVQICPTHAIETFDQVKKYERKILIVYSQCIYCGLCQEICPENAIFMSKRKQPSFKNTQSRSIRSKLAKCKGCGELFTTPMMLNKTMKDLRKTGIPKAKVTNLNYCPECKKRNSAYRRVYALNKTFE